MHKSLILWTVAFVITAASAAYQRMTGPTYPLHGMTTLADHALTYSLPRSEEQKDAVVRIPVGREQISGWIEWKRLNTQDPWMRVPMVLRDSFLVAELPVQPPAGKLQYRVHLEKGEKGTLLPADGPAVIRFKGNVPLMVIIPHVFIIFMGMLLSTRTGFEVFREKPDYTVLTYLTLGFLIVGGLVFGPIMQKYAFDAYWTGWPFGKDLTDNKTAVAVIAWCAAAVALRKSKNPKVWVIAAAVVVFVVFLIPHSLLGSELDYSTLASPEGAPSPTP